MNQDEKINDIEASFVEDKTYPRLFKFAVISLLIVILIIILVGSNQNAMCPLVVP